MAEPRNARQTGSGREYVWPPTGERFVSVTTVLNVINKPALVRWAAKMTAEYAAKNLDDWQNLDTAAAVDLLKGAPWRYNKERVDLGVAVHETCEAWNKGTNPPNWPDAIYPYMAQFHKFLNEFEPVIEHSEVSVYSRKHGYAGTLDLLSGFGNELVLIDFKTGKAAYGESELQLNAYAGADFIGLPNGETLPMPRIDQAAVLLLRPMHYELLPARLSPRLFEAFLAALQLWRWWDQISPEAFNRRWLPKLANTTIKVPAGELLSELPEEEVS